MKRIDIPRLLVTGLHSGVGKTTVTTALLYELRRRGVQVAAALTAPNLEVASVYERITGRSVMCLDPLMLTRQQLLEGLERSATGSELLIVDGSKGLLDTNENSSCAPDAEFASLTHTPILFVVDVRQHGVTLAAAVRGVQQAARGIEWAGIAMNRLGAGHDGRAALVAGFEHYRAASALVGLPNLDPAPPIIPNLVGQIRNSTLLDRTLIASAADALLSNSDLEQLIARASSAPALECEIPDPDVQSRMRVAVARDSCFGLMFHDNIEILRRHGAEIVEFSPLTDAYFPKDVNGVYFPGGYIAEYGAQLALNESLRTQIATFLARGGGLYAEGASLAYLANRYRGVEMEGEFPGIGVFPALCVSNRAAGAPLRAEGVLLEAGATGESGDLIKGLYPGDWSFDVGPAVPRLLRIVPGQSNAVLEGYAPANNVFGTFGFWHFGSCPNLAPTLIHTFALSSGSPK